MNIGRFSLVLLLLAVPGILPAQSPSPVETADQLYRHLAEEGFQPARQPLAQEGDFPYSILLGEGGRSSGAGAGSLIVSIPQETALRCLGELSSLLRVMDASAGMTLALLANETPPLPFDRQWHPGGPQVLLDSISDPESRAVVMLDSPSRPPRQVTVVPGAGGKMSPLWLLRLLQLPVPQGSLITYRLDLAAESPALAAFFRSGMAAVGVRFDADDEEQVRQVFSALERLVLEYNSAEMSRGASENYMAFSFPDNFWVGEEIFILLYLLIAVLVLALLSGFSFLGKRGDMNRRAFFRIWHLIPITILLSALFLWLGQQVATILVDATPENTIAILGMKTIFSFIAISLPFIFHLRLRLNISRGVYGYLLTIVAAMNIFIFTSIDLVLLFVFAIEYVIVYFSRLAKRIVPLVLASFAMLLPFVPYILNILEYASPDRLLDLACTGVPGNILYGCLLAPFQIMWLRILVRLDIFGTRRNIPPPRMAIATTIVMATMIASVTLLVVSGSLLLYRSFPGIGGGKEASSGEYGLVSRPGPLPVSISVAQSGYLELRSVTVGIDSSLPVLRYDVRVLAKAGLPVYDSAMEFQTVQEDDGTEQVLASRFLIPDYPAERSSLQYTAASGMEQEVQVTVYVEVGPLQAAAVERTVILPAVGSEG